MDSQNEGCSPLPRRHSAEQVVRRYSRMTGLVPRATYGSLWSKKVTELSGDTVRLDWIELTLIEAKKAGRITGSRMVAWLARHQRDLGRG